MALTAAIWDDGSLRIDGYPLRLDKAQHEGHTYSDKAPGQPFFAVPAYALYRAVGGEPAAQLRVEGNLGLWATTLWSSSLPLAVLLILVRRVAASIERSVSTLVALATGFSTLLLPFSSLLFGHVLGATLAFAGWMLVRNPDASRRYMALAGGLLGGAVLVEYQLILAALAISAHVIWRWRRRAVPFIVGALPAAIALALYQWAAFGSPFSFSYASSSFGDEAAAIGLEELDPPLLENASRVIFGDRGLLLTSPVLALGAAGMFLLLRRTTGHHRSAYAAAAFAAASVVIVQIFWSNPTGGDSPGARYATAAAAFLAPGIAAAWRRWPLAAVVTGLLGAMILLAALWTDPLEARDSSGAIGIWLSHVLHGEWGPSLFTMAFGRWAGIGVVVSFAVGVLAFLMLTMGHADDDCAEVTPRPAAPVSNP